MPFQFGNRVSNIFSNVFNPNRYIPQQLPAIQSPTSQLELPDLSTPNMDAYVSHVGQMPQRGKSSLLQKIFAGMAGAGEGWHGGAMKGYEAVRNILDTPYINALNDWGVKAGALDRAAALESLNLGRENSMLRNQITADYNTAKIDLGYDQLQQRKIEAENRGWKTTEVEDDAGRVNVLAFNPVNGQQINLGRSPKVGSTERVETRDKTFQNRLDVAGKYNEGRIASTNIATGAAQARQDDQQEFRMQHPDLYQGTRGPNVSLMKYNDQEALRNLVLKHREWRGKYIFMKPNGELYIATPPNEGGLFSNFDPQVESDLQMLDTEYNSMRGMNRINTNQIPQPGPGQITISSPDGKQYKIVPAAEEQMWLQRGAKIALRGK